ncbi:unnamed protein product [Calicophoron daubneyi]|uniref:Uncharacterized protein n=1 Tax=Calicophoron daubneyi TaxID=300641 RepID=A0AAV2TWR5_CALDB
MDTSNVDFNSSLLAKLSETLRDRICTKSFVNLQRRTNQDLTVASVVKLLSDENELKRNMNLIVNSVLLCKLRKSEATYNCWNEESFVATKRCITAIAEARKNSYRRKLRKALDAYLTHLNNVDETAESRSIKNSHSPRGMSHTAANQKGSVKRLRELQTSGKILWARDGVSKGPHYHNTFEQQPRPVPHPLSWASIKYYNINSKERARSRRRFCGTFNRCTIGVH